MNNFKIGERVKVVNPDDDRDVRKYEGATGKVDYATSIIGVVIVQLDDGRTAIIPPSCLELEVNHTEAEAMNEENESERLLDDFRDWRVGLKDCMNLPAKVAMEAFSEELDALVRSIRADERAKVEEQFFQKYGSDSHINECEDFWIEHHLKPMFRGIHAELMEKVKPILEQIAQLKTRPEYYGNPQRSDDFIYDVRLLWDDEEIIEAREVLAALDAGAQGEDANA